MSLNEIDAKIEKAANLLREAAQAIKPLVPEDARREDEMLNAFHAVGGSVVQARAALGMFRDAVRKGTSQ